MSTQISWQLTLLALLPMPLMAWRSNVTAMRFTNVFIAQAAAHRPQR
ncbi:hypothetical protein MJ585_06635 [Klebsiella pneumoniae]|nr:hypothetical protein MJ585_06635 [Klebsiella pneumoniae]